MHLKNIFTVFTLLFILAGCSTTEKQVQKQKIVNELDNAPTWVKAPQEKNYISEIGKSTYSDKPFIVQRDEAIEDSKANLSYKLDKKITNIFSLVGKKYIDDENFMQIVQNAKNEIVSNAVNEARVMKLWKSNKNNIYIMTSAKLEDIEKNLQAIIYTTFKNYPNLQSQYNLHKEQGDIHIKLNN